MPMMRLRSVVFPAFVLIHLRYLRSFSFVRKSVLFTKQLLVRVRKQKNITAKRNEKNTKQVGNWCLNDQVRLFGQVGWISGFSGKSCYVKDINGNYLTIPNKTYKQVSLSSLQFICRNNNWQYQEISAYAD